MLGAEEVKRLYSDLFLRAFLGRSCAGLTIILSPPYFFPLFFLRPFPSLRLCLPQARLACHVIGSLSSSARQEACGIP